MHYNTLLLFFCKVYKRFSAEASLRKQLSAFLLHGTRLFLWKAASIVQNFL